MLLDPLARYLEQTDKTSWVESAWPIGASQWDKGLQFMKHDFVSSLFRDFVIGSLLEGFSKLGFRLPLACFSEEGTHIRIHAHRIFFVVFIIFFSLILSSFSRASITPFQASPDQVLVLYNEDWPKDVDGSEPGQDSKEVAEYYVKMHTDPVTGKKPYLLSLGCTHREKHLNQWVIREKSQDNKDGIVFVGKGKGLKTGEWARDSRHVEIVLDPLSSSFFTGKF